MINHNMVRWVYIGIAVLIIIGLCFCILVSNSNTAYADNNTQEDILETIAIVETEPAPTNPTEPEIQTLPEAEPIITEQVIDQEDLEMLAIIIYHEAGGDACCDDCRRRVADVVLNRVADDRFPNTIEEVLTQHGQYNYLWIYGIHWPSRAEWDSEKNAVDRAYRIAEEVLRGQHSEVYGEGYVFHMGANYTDDYIACHDCGIYFSR